MKIDAEWSLLAAAASTQSKASRGSIKQELVTFRWLPVVAASS